MEPREERAIILKALMDIKTVAEKGDADAWDRFEQIWTIQCGALDAMGRGDI